MLFQQGDVLLTRIRRVNGGKKLDHRILAEGEVTGHAHRASAGALLDFGTSRVLRVPRAGATISHEEHAPISLPPGDYDVRIVREYDHFAEEARNVID